MSEKDNLHECRCKYCNKLFFKADLEHAKIEIKCKNCKNISLIKGKDCALWGLLDKDSVKEMDCDNFMAIVTKKCSDCKDNEKCLAFRKITQKHSCPMCGHRLK